MSTASGEWRIDGLDERTFAAAVRRAQGEFLEMPGLRLSEAEAARLWSLDATLCSAVLSELVKSRFLVRTRRALFVRP